MGALAALRAALAALAALRAALGDNGRYVHTLVFLVAFGAVQSLTLCWVSPATLYFAAGWDLRIRRIVSAVCFVIFGLLQLAHRIRHATSAADALFGVASPAPRSEHIAAVVWSASLQYFSVFTWSPLTRYARYFATVAAETDSAPVRYLHLAVLASVQLLRAFVWTTLVILLGCVWLLLAITTPILSLFAVPYAVFVSVVTLWLCFLYIFLAHETDIPPYSRLAIAEARTLMLDFLRPRYALQVVATLASSLGCFSCRDRWYRRDALHAGISAAVRATLPGLIGPIACDQRDISQAVAAMRGLHNVWTNLEEKETFLDDPATLVYSLSYKHLPVYENGSIIRLSEDRATLMLRQVMDVASRHGYTRFMMWCDGASAAGARINSSWVDIGLLPYAIYRTVRVNTYTNGDSITSGRLWLELEKSLSTLTCGMDVVNEYETVRHGDDYGSLQPRLEYGVEDAVAGQGHKAMAAVLRLSSKIAQKSYAEYAVWREEDQAEIAAWARKMLMRSGRSDMNEALGWSGDPRGDRRARAVLTRVTTFTLRGDDEAITAEVAYVGVSDSAFSAGRTEFWLGLLGFTEEEMGKIENEELEWVSVQFEESTSGRWEMLVVNLQGDFYVSMAAFREVGERIEEQRGKGGWWLLTNSQVKKNSETEDWAKNIISEKFKNRGLECEVEQVAHDYKKAEEEDSAVSWFSAIMGEIGDWQQNVFARSRERKGQGEESKA